jgi:DedD protein
MATRLEPTEPAVDELKRRARRRLIGAIVLALAAAVILPVLLESEPKPFGDDVSVKIPPIDDGKFVNPLSPASPSAAQGAAGSASTPALPQANGAGDAQRRPLEQSGPPPAPALSSARAAAASTADATTPPKAAPAEASTAAGSRAAGAGFVVQVGAFVDAQAAADVAAKLNGAGFRAYTEASAAAQGGDARLNRVRVGPFSSREAADAALAKLKTAGYSSAIVSAK